MLKKSNLLALDVGERRIGVAIVADDVAVPRLLPTLQNDSSTISHLKAIVQQRLIERIVIGLPRNLNGQETLQTKNVRNFAKQLETTLALPVDFQDEALTSVLAEQILKTRRGTYHKSDIDSLAALQILLDYLGDDEK